MMGINAIHAYHENSNGGKAADRRTPDNKAVNPIKI